MPKTKRVALFNSPYIKQKKDSIEEENVHARIGIASIASYLRKRKIPVKVIDSIDIKKIGGLLKDFSPDIIGIPAFTFEVHDAAITAEFAKSVCPGATAIVGGPHPSAMPKETLKQFDVLDIAVIGEGEDTVKELAQGKDYKDINGIAYREGNEIKITAPRQLVEDIDTLELPLWEEFDFSKRKTWCKEANKYAPYFPIEGARGCPFPCIFCFRITGKSMRYKSPSRVADEMEVVIAHFGFSKFYFVEGTFGINRKQAVDLSDEIVTRGLNKKMLWEVSARVDCVDKEMLEKMKEAGCIQIGFGIESGDPEMLKAMKKGFTIEDTVKAIDLCKKAGLEVGGNFILGFPYETEENIKKTINFAKSLPIDTANFAIMVPFPGTEIREMAKKNIGGMRLLTDDWQVYGKQIGKTLELEQLPQKELLRLQTKAYMNFYLSPRRFVYFLKGLNWNRFVYAVKRAVEILTSWSRTPSTNAQ